MAILDKIKDFFAPGDVKAPIDLGDGEKEKGDDDELLLKKLKFRKDEAEKILKPKFLDWEKQLKFFDGDHWAVAGVSIPTYKSDMVINKWFAAVRSLVAFETDAKPDPEVEAIIDVTDPNYVSVVAGAKKVEAMLDYRWDKANVPITLTEIYYDRYNFDDGFGWYFWNSEIDDVDFEQIKPHELMRSPGSTCVEDAEYIIIGKNRNMKWFIKYFPELVKENKIKFEEMKIDFLYQFPQSAFKPEYQNACKVYHYFEDEIWITFTEDQVLEKIKNPHWVWDSPQEQEKKIIEAFKTLPLGWQAVKNHLVKAEKPIVHFKGYHLGGEFYSKSLVKQIAKLAIAINKRKCQIQDNADGMGNGQWLIDPSVPLDKVNMITSKPGLKIRINPNLARKETPPPLPEYIFLDLQHSEQRLDDIIGHHEISRGVQSTKRQTRGEAMLLRETDITPVRLLMRNSEAAINKLLNGWVQLMKMYYDQPHYIGAVSSKLREGVGQMLKREDIPDQLSIQIKVGSSLPTSREQKRAEYQADLQRGVLDPLTYLELMSYPNPMKILQRIKNWQMGIIGDQPTPAPAAAPAAVPPAAPPPQ
jgi:hypothetical protein